MNLFDLASLGAMPMPEEVFETLQQAPGVRIERIVSTGHTTPLGQWYDQTDHEWVVVLQGQAELEYSNGQRDILNPGDSCWLPAHTRHRVAFTSQKPPCIWLAVHISAQR